MNINSRIYLFLLKRLFPILLCWLIALYAVYFYFLRGIPVFYEYSLTMFLFLIAGCGLFYLLLLHLMRYQLQKINSILKDDCDPQTFTDIYRDMLRQSANIKRRVNLSFMKINISAGLSDAGEYQEALEISSGITPDTSSNAGILTAIVYHHNACIICKNLGDIEKAEYHLLDLQKILNGLKENNKVKAIYETRSKVLQSWLNMDKGCYDNAESVFTKAFDSAKSKQGKVNITFFLGKVYLHNGDTARAKEAFEYVIKHGNKLHVAEEAKEQLARLL